ncbi:bifunctional NAD(P)H-hydrate repair enzyme [Betaproteobacteria bacterium]|nr:bifunctional NAD(P)H-hydrate repair enzyme [Betaproteobacteria bacterium]GHU42833.1 bifunctional NAD(P)H-hydrate repair enzyme [Betaproteobacteria bacterium]
MEQNTKQSPPPALFNRDSLRRLEAAHASEPLMLRAATAAALLVETLRAGRPEAVLALAGPGNNGGDALTMATLLRRQGVAVTTVFIGEGDALPADASAAYQQFINEGWRLLPDIPADIRWSLIVDGLFGIGLARPLSGREAQLVKTANRLAAEQGCPLLALDCPSGLDADTGFCRGDTIRATHTLSFIAAKPGFYTADGADHCGQVLLDDLGVDAEKNTDIPADGHLLDRSVFASCLRPRKCNTHKGTYGSVGIVGGAHSMMGAALLSGRAALKMGAGRVFLGLLDPQAPGADFGHPELMLKKPEGVFDTELSALACGPGLGRSDRAGELLERAIASAVPLVLDADALNILAFDDGDLQQRLRQRAEPVLLTPHPAEAARLLDLQTVDIQKSRIHMAQELAHRYNAWVVLKGCGSVVCNPEGKWWINTTGNPGLAGPGTGDVLTGILTALLGQGWQPEAALQAAVHLHGQAADDLVEEGLGPVGLTAGELIHAARVRFNRWIAGKP